MAKTLTELVTALGSLLRGSDTAPRDAWLGMSTTALLSRAVEGDPTLPHDLMHMPWHAVRDLDRSLRHEWWSVDQVRLRKRLAQGAVDWPLACMAMSHMNGHARQAAVAYFGEHWHPGALAFVVLRLADWVEPLRQQALATLRQQVLAADTAMLLTMRGALGRLRAARPEKTAIIELLDEVLRQPARQGDMLTRLSRDTPIAIRRQIYDVLSARPENAETLLVRCCADPDLSVRALVYRRCAHALEGQQAAALLRAAKSERTLHLRGLLYRTCEEKGLLGQEDYDRMLTDRAAEVRRLAVHALEAAQPNFRAREAYLAMFRAAPGITPLGAMAGLLQYGGAEDLELFLAMGDDPRAGARKWVVLAMSKFAPRAHANQLAEALFDTPGVARLAAEALRGHVTSAVERTLRTTAFDATAPAHARIHALALLVERSRWDGVTDLTLACASPCEAVQHAATRMLARWHERANRSAVDPTQAQLDAWEAAKRAVAEVRAHGQGDP